jgi:predicted GTPase
MMKEIVIAGRPNSGKTMFAINFAAYLGCTYIDILLRGQDDLNTCRRMAIDEARKELCSLALHKTRYLQSLLLKLSFGKTIVDFKLTDTCGLTEGIHQEESVRKGMAQTIGSMRSANLIFHMIDLSSLTVGSIDQEIFKFGMTRSSYGILANKIDLPAARERLISAATKFPRAYILPISALHSKGFKEVRSHVVRNL